MNLCKNTEKYNLNKKRKLLIVFGDMTSDMLSNKKLNPIVTELFVRIRKLSQPATERRGNVVMTSLHTFQHCHRYVPNEKPNDIQVERRQQVSVLRLLDVFLEFRDNVSTGPNNDVSSVLSCTE